MFRCSKQSRYSIQTMKALILVGGFGTRLRPLTFAMPKPLVPFANKPMIIHQIEALKAVGVTEVILAVAYQPDAMKAQMDEWAVKLGMKFHYSHEVEPMGTAGPIALAKSLLEAGDSNEPFFVLNSDVTCTFPLKDLLAFHKAHGHEGTIMVTKVDDPSKYGVVIYDGKSGEISTFAEKPKTFVGDKINAGIYCFNKSMISRIPLERTSIETQVFPAMAKDKELYCMELPGFWADIGQPHDYLDGLALFLPTFGGSQEAVVITPEEAKRRGFVVQGPVVLHPTSIVEPGAVLGPNVTVGANTTIGANVRLVNTAVFSGTKVGAGSFISRSIIAWNNTIGPWCRVENNTVTGDDVQIKPELYVNGAKILPNKGIGASIMQPQIVM